MSNIRIFVDFGSTFTKAVAFDMDREELAARVQTPSTVDTDVTDGLTEAVRLLSERADICGADVKRTVACSSAAGGLRMACVGLVPEYTTEAGRMAALGAGAKVVGSFSYELSRSETARIESLLPDIVLLTGGTDGGNKKVITANARALARSSVKNVIVAGNKSAYDDIEGIFYGSGKNVLYAQNVMPEFGKLELADVNKRIRELFLDRITEAKGVAKAKSMIGELTMPTPSAVMEAATLIALGAGEESGLGELLLIDVGGATTDVYSVARGIPGKDGVTQVGLPEPFVKRTVEGDLGLYHNLDVLTELAASEDETLNTRESQPLRERRSVPEGADMTEYQLRLSTVAVKTAVERHVGRVELLVTHNGEFWLQRGKDLTQIKLIIGAGGPLAFSADPRRALSGALFSQSAPEILKPQSPAFLLDEKYILYAVGLLAQSEPEKALRIVKKYLRRL